MEMLLFVHLPVVFLGSGARFGGPRVVVPPFLFLLVSLCEESGATRLKAEVLMYLLPPR
jgi:hypothetical protein